MTTSASYLKLLALITLAVLVLTTAALASSLLFKNGYISLNGILEEWPSPPSTDYTATLWCDRESSPSECVLLWRDRSGDTDTGKCDIGYVGLYTNASGLYVAINATRIPKGRTEANIVIWLNKTDGYKHQVDIKVNPAASDPSAFLQSAHYRLYNPSGEIIGSKDIIGYLSGNIVCNKYYEGGDVMKHTGEIKVLWNWLDVDNPDNPNDLAHSKPVDGYYFTLHLSEDVMNIGGSGTSNRVLINFNSNNYIVGVSYDSTP
ncbi:MAG: hypothetical protein QW705_06460 [Zestosphaera sp.]